MMKRETETEGGEAVIRAGQEGSGIESNLGQSNVSPHNEACVDILLASTGCCLDFYIYTPKWCHCRVTWRAEGSFDYP